MNTSQELQAIVKKYQEGDTEIFNQIYRISYGYLYTCVITLVKDEEIAMDMLQETYMEISKSIYQLKNVESFLSWSSTIANRKCLAYLNKTKGIFVSIEDDEEFFENIADDEKFIPEEFLQNQEKRQLIKEIIDGLSDMQRLCVIGYYYNELKQEEIAQELGIPVNTVKTHLNRAKTKIKKAVIELEEKKGTRLYSFAPFLSLYFTMEAEACQAAANDSFGNITKETVNHSAEEVRKDENVSSDKLKSTKKALKTKIMIGTAVLIGMVGIGTFIALNTDDSKTTEVNVTEVDTTEADTTEADVTEADTTVQETGFHSNNALAIADLYEAYLYGNKGLIPVYKDGKWGLVTYDNQIIVPIEYDYCCDMANDEGQTFFGKPGDYQVFDREGKELFRTTERIISVSEGVILTEKVNEEDDSCKITYYELDGDVLYQTEETEWEVYADESGAVGFSEGYGFFRYDEEKRIDRAGELYSIFEAQYAEKIAEVQAYNAGHEGYEVALAEEGYPIPIGSASQGYYVAEARGDYPYWCGCYYLYSADGTERYRLAMSSVYCKEGLSFSQSDYEYNVHSYYENGTSHYNYETLMCVSLSDGETTSYYLIDVTKLEQKDAEAIEAAYDGTDESVLDFDLSVITEEALIANGDYIGMNTEKYWLISKEGKWGYIDHEGNVKEMYQDAADFHKGKAIVIEDGIAYWIDETFEKIEEICPVETVANHGAVFIITKSDGSTIMVTAE